MDFQDVVRQRRMVRRYDPGRSPDPDVVRDLLALATSAPSAGNSQGWHFVVLSNAEDTGRFWRATTPADNSPNQWLRGMRTAPVLVLALSEPEVYLDRYAEADKGWTDRSRTRWAAPYWDIDTGMASLLLLLGAVDCGLVGCFFGIPVECSKRVRDTFQIPEQVNLVGAVAIGYEARGSTKSSSPLRRGRRSLTDVVSYGTYGEPAPTDVSRETTAVDST